MFTAIKIESPVKHDVFESLNNGTWYYNYGIEEKMVIVRDMETDEEVEEPRYTFLQILIKGMPTVSKCYEEVLKAFKNEDQLSLYDAKQLGEAPQEQLDDIFYDVQVDFDQAEKLTPIEKAKREQTRKIDLYDKSSEVNSFYLNGIQVWLDKDTRVGLMNSLTIEQDAGKEQSTLWFGNICIVINCDAAIQMLSALELYALECYNKTAEHKAAILNFGTVDEVLGYDYTAGYPSKLSFNV